MKKTASNKVPDSLYRYIKFNEERLENILIRNKLHFYSPAKLNDPYDGKVRFSVSDCKEEDFKLLYREIIRKHSPTMDEEDAKNRIEEEMKLERHGDSDWLTWLRESAKEHFQPDINKIGLFCLSQKRESILMWSHYSNNHQGLCLVFSTKFLQSKFVCEKIRYNNKYVSSKDFLFTFLGEDNAKQVKQILLRKSMAWKYESEWRAIVPRQAIDENGGDRNFNYPEEMLTGIIFGCEMDDKDKDIVRTMLAKREHKPKLFQAIKNEDRFALDIKEIN